LKSGPKLSSKINVPEFPHHAVASWGASNAGRRPAFPAKLRVDSRFEIHFCYSGWVIWVGILGGMDDF
jgi:hypothetical protein